MAARILAAALSLALAAMPARVAAALDMAGVFDSTGPEITISWEYLETPGRKAEMQAVIDGFAAMVDNEFLPRDPHAGIEIVMTDDAAHFASYMRRNYPAIDIPKYGVFVSDGRLVTYSRSGVGTVTSLLLPGLLRDGYDDLPQWAVTGLRTYFEKFYGFWETDAAAGQRVVRFAHGYHNPWRLQDIRLLLPDLKLANLVSDTPTVDGTRYQSQQRLLMIFIWKEGKLPAFMAALRARDRKMYPTYLEAVFGQPLEALQPRFRAFQETILAHWNLVMRTPPSQVYADRATFEAMTASVWR
ncbi:hypothetical protein [Emcibacter sp. SYSU 3D8]|uniref:hypothetical protein n=1 Tax=Emcibacter sp. SYSU 3D8 TaxID=3133969 RepID=UPI0031FE9C47